MMDTPGSGRIVVVGSLNLDLVVDVDRLPHPGETVEGRRFATARGGKGANQAVAAARLCAAPPGSPTPVHIVGRVGDDWFGRDLLAGLDEAGVGRDAVVVDPDATTGVASILIDADRENYITAVYGANAACDAHQVRAATELLDGAAVLLTQLEIPVAVTAACIQAARDRGVIVILDPAPVRPLPRDFLRHVDVLTPNQREAETMTGVPVTGPDPAATAAAALRSLGAGAVIVTMGAAGAYVDADGAAGFVPAFSIEALSTLAAGDAFNGALAVALAEGRPLTDAVPFAMAAAAICVARSGAAEAMPARAEVEAFLRAFPA